MNGKISGDGELLIRRPFILVDHQSSQYKAARCYRNDNKTCSDKCVFFGAWGLTSEDIYELQLCIRIIEFDELIDERINK